MIATGICNNPAFRIFIVKTDNFVVSPAEFKSTDGLQVFRLQKELAPLPESVLFVNMRLQ